MSPLQGFWILRAHRIPWALPRADEGCRVAAHAIGHRSNASKNPCVNQRFPEETYNVRTTLNTEVQKDAVNRRLPVPCDEQFGVSWWMSLDPAQIEHAVADLAHAQNASLNAKLE
jgi:hypothetical protein